MSRQQAPAHVKPVFFGLRRLGRLAPKLTQRSLNIALLRELMMAVPLSTGGRAIPASTAFELTMDFVNAVGFEATFKQAERFVGGKSISVPVTVAFGTHDWLLTPSARLRHELPAHTEWLAPKGWGHVPMWKDPEGVARLILQATR